MLEWRNGAFDHRPALRRFQCTDPATVTFDEERGFESHDLPWEFEVQDHFQGLHPPHHPPSFLLLGFDEGALTAAIELGFAPLDSYAYVHALGVATHASGRGLGGEALDRVHNVFSKFYRMQPPYLVDAHVDEDNDPAKRVFAKRGYELLEKEGRFERWGRWFR